MTGRRITGEVTDGLLNRARKATGKGVKKPFAPAPHLFAASETYAGLSAYKGKVRFSKTLAERKSDR